MPGSCPGEVLVRIGSYIYPIDLSDECSLDVPNNWPHYSSPISPGSSAETPSSERLSHPSTPVQCPLESTKCGAPSQENKDFQQYPNVPQPPKGKTYAPRCQQELTTQMTLCHLARENHNSTECKAFVKDNWSFKEECQTESHIVEKTNNTICQPSLADLILNVDNSGEVVTSSTVDFYQAVHTDVQSVHTDVQGVHTYVQSVHTDVQSVHADVQSVHTDVQGVAHYMDSYLLSDCSREFREDELFSTHLDNDRSIWKNKNLVNETLCQFNKDVSLQVKKNDGEDMKGQFPVGTDDNANIRDMEGNVQSTYIDENGNNIWSEFGLYPQLENVQSTDGLSLQSSTNTRPNKKPQQRGCKIWEFVRNLLLDPATNPSLIRWEDKNEGTFRLIEPKTISYMWGMKRGNEDMNYEKLSRAMRYHYKRKVLTPVKGRNLIYRFGPNATGWK